MEIVIQDAFNFSGGKLAERVKVLLAGKYFKVLVTVVFLSLSFSTVSLSYLPSPF